jgi:O-antigen/teichoic acid export membrane protein
MSPMAGAYRALIVERLAGAVGDIHPLVWSVSQQVVRQAIAFAAFLVIARHIQPADLGLLGIAMLWMGFLNVFTDLGFSAALIQRPAMTEAHVSTAFYLNFAVGLLLTTVGLACASIAASVLETPAAAPVMQWLSLGFVFSALSTVQNALAQRELRFASLAIRDTIGITAGAAVGITAALRGWGVYSLVAQSLTSASVGTILLWGLSPYRFAIRSCSLRAFRDLWAFGSFITVFGIFKYVARNVDALLIGTMLGPPALGLYMFAQQLVTRPVTPIEGGIGAFMFARAAALQHQRERLACLFLSAFDLLNAVLVAWALVVSIAAPPVLRLYFGDKWDASLALIWLPRVMSRRPSASRSGWSHGRWVSQHAARCC